MAWTRLRDHPSAVLLVGQLVVVLVYPFLDAATAGRAVIGVVQMALVLTAVVAVRRTPALTGVALVFGLPATVFAVAGGARAGHDWAGSCSPPRRCTRRSTSTSPTR